MPVSTIPSISPASAAADVSSSSHAVSFSSEKVRTATKVRSRSGNERWLAMLAQSPVAMMDEMARR